jgi:hypothetical protein
MKNGMFLLAVFVAIFTGCSSKPDLVGKWEDDKGFGYKMSFKNDGTGTMGAPEVTKETIYTVDETKTPAWIDIKLLKPNKEIESTALGSFRFIDDNTLEIMVSAKGRKTAIDSTDIDYMRMKRQG